MINIIKRKGEPVPSVLNIHILIILKADHIFIFPCIKFMHFYYKKFTFYINYYL